MGGAAVGDGIPVVPILVGAAAGIALLVWLLRR